MYAVFNSILVAMDGSQGGLDAAALAADLAAPGADVAIEEVGLRAVGLHEQVAAHGADLLVVGAHHHGHLVRRARDPARVALRDMTCAVAVAPRRFAGRAHHVTRTIGVGYTDDRAGRAVLDVARGLAWQLGAEVQATMVVAPSNWQSATSGVGWRAAAAARRMAEIPGVHGTAIEGLPDRVLAELSTDVDLLVIGSRHHAAWRLPLGDVAGSLSHSSRCPLLVVPHPPDA